MFTDHPPSPDPPHEWIKVIYRRACDLLSAHGIGPVLREILLRIIGRFFD